MSLDDQIRAALDRTLAAVRGPLEAELRALAQELARTAAEERGHAVAQAAEAAAAEMRRQAQAQLTHLRETTQRHTDEIRRAADAQVAELKQRLEAAVRDSSAARESERQARAARDAAQAETDQVRGSVSMELGSQIMRLAESARALDEAGGLGELLDALADAAAREVERAAVLVVKDDRLTGWRLHGFAAAGPPRTLQVARAELAPALARNAQSALPVFAQGAGPRHAAAFPVIVGGVMVAALYADAPRDTGAAVRWPAALELLTRHAGRMLESMTVQRALGVVPPPPMAYGSLPDETLQGGPK